MQRTYCDFCGTELDVSVHNSYNLVHPRDSNVTTYHFYEPRFFIDTEDGTTKTLDLCSACFIEACKHLTERSSNVCRIPE